MGGSSLGVGMIGYSFMGAVHSHAWRTVGRVFDLGVDVDIIDVCTPGSSHEEIAVAALNAGKHVICEKPLANTVAEAERMAAAAQASSGKSMLNEPRTLLNSTKSNTLMSWNTNWISPVREARCIPLKRLKRG